jgi:hypothetical protein
MDDEENDLSFLFLDEGESVVESSEACFVRFFLPSAPRSPSRTTFDLLAFALLDEDIGGGGGGMAWVNITPSNPEKLSLLLVRWIKGFTPPDGPAPTVA